MFSPKIPADIFVIDCENQRHATLPPIRKDKKNLLILLCLLFLSRFHSVNDAWYTHFTTKNITTIWPCIRNCITSWLCPGVSFLWMKIKHMKMLIFFSIVSVYITEEKRELEEKYETEQEKSFFMAVKWWNIGNTNKKFVMRENIKAKMIILLVEEAFEKKSVSFSFNLVDWWSKE